MTPLFVVGAPRSGTTLTRTLLKGFAPVYLPPDEFQILPRFIARAEAGATAQDLVAMVSESVFAGHMRRRGLWPDEAALAARMDGLSPAEAFRALVLAIAEQDGQEQVVFWGDKTPETVFQLDLIARLWPDARIIEVVRDPRSTVLSMHRAWGRSLLRGSVIWRDARAATRAFAGRHGRERLHTLSFEALTADPGAEMARIGDWLGLDYDHATLATASSEERWGRAAGSTGVRAQKADWEAALSDRQIRQIEEICFDEMIAAGISPTRATARRAPDAMALKLAKAGDALRVLQAYARERGWPAAVSYKVSQWQGRRSS
jgi:hypothetical protein